MHTAEHILNGTMVKMFGCGRAVSAHVERTKTCPLRSVSLPSKRLPTAST